MIDSTAPYGGDRFYRINKCLDNVQWLMLAVNKYFNAEEDDKASTLPPPEHTIAVLIQVKQTFNQHHAMRRLAPRSANKVGIRLIKFVLGLERLCRRRLLPPYPRTLVQDVSLRPNLSEGALCFIQSLLTSQYAYEAWRRLGPSWNEADSRYTTYSSDMLSPSSVSTMTARQFGTSSTLQSQAVGQSLEKGPTDTVYSSQRPQSLQHESSSAKEQIYFRKLQENGASLCIATQSHDTTDVNEICAKTGQMFEILDSSMDKYWLVRDSANKEGNLPAEKAKKISLPIEELKHTGNSYCSARAKSGDESVPRHLTRPLFTEVGDAYGCGGNAQTLTSNASRQFEDSYMTIYQPLPASRTSVFSSEGMCDPTPPPFLIYMPSGTNSAPNTANRNRPVYAAAACLDRFGQKPASPLIWAPNQPLLSPDYLPSTLSSLASPQRSSRRHPRDYIATTIGSPRDVPLLECESYQPVMLLRGRHSDSVNYNIPPC